MKAYSLLALAAVVFCGSSYGQTHPLAEARRFTRGGANDPLIQSAVIPADQQRGVQLNPLGNNAALFGNPPTAELPWFCRIQRQLRYHIQAVASGSYPFYVDFENPIVAFGEGGGGTPLSTNRDYRFGVFAGLRDYSAPPNTFPGVFRIRAYLASALASGQTNVAPVDEITFELPWPGDANWSQFLQNGARKVVDFHGLKTTVEIVGSAVTDGDPEQWRTWDDPFVLTHRASTADYYFVVEYKGYTIDFGFFDPIVSTTLATPPSAGFSSLYALDFTVPPAWRSTLVHAPHFEGEPVPSWYYGRSLEELQGAWSFSPSTPGDALKTAKTVDHSAELRSHPALDAFVTDMGSDPIALANYVFNEIELTDPISYNEDGSYSDASINCGGLNRGAVATFLEGQGNPWEQCALLTYLLRKANVAAVYCEPEKDKLGMLDTQMSHLLRMQIKGAQTPDGTALMPEIIPTNYPWVSAWIESESRWVHLFPWIKDTEVIEGGNLYDQFPDDTKTGTAWVRKYLQADPSVLPDQIAAYQQDSGGDGLVVVEAEGFHTQVAKNGKRWEPLESGGPTGYSGSSWLRPMPNSGTNNSAAGYSSLSPRLDYEVNFTRTGTHYIWVRGQGATTNDNTVHVGLNGTEVTTGSSVGNFGTSFGWLKVNTTGVVRTLNIPSVGRHRISVWMQKDGFRFDKLLLTTSSTYNPTSAGANGPKVSTQTVVEPNLPSNLFPRYARQNLGANVSFDSLGMKYRDRRHSRATWDDFPKPFNLYPGSHQFFERLADRTDTFDTVRVELWSDRNGDGLYNGPSVDAAYMDTGEWLSSDLHNRRFYTACRKTGTNTHQLRLYLGPYRAGTSGTGAFTGADKLQEQLLTANLTATDDALQFELTHRRQKRVAGLSVLSVDVTAGGSGYTTAPAVTFAAPPAGANHRTATGTAQVSGGKVTKVTITDYGFGYNSPPSVTFTGGGGTGAVGKANLQDGIQRWTHPLGIISSQVTALKPSIRKGELAAINLNFGRVTDRMLRAHAQDFWSYERALQATPTLKDDADFQEKVQSTSAYLMGMAYYNRVAKFGDINQRLHKVRILSVYAAGLSKLAPYRDVSGALPNSGDIIPKLATVDMTYSNIAFAANSTAHPDSGATRIESINSFRALSIEGSAQEHAIIDDYYKQSEAISTVKLLHRAKLLPAGARILTKLNYVAEGNTNYTFGSTTKTLKNWNLAIWAAIEAAFNGPGGYFAEVFITPGPVASASGSYTGMGAMIFEKTGTAALITEDMNLTNGGNGAYFDVPYYSGSELPNIVLNSNGDSYNIDYFPPVSSDNPVVAPGGTTSWHVNQTAANLNSGAYVASDTLSTQLNNNAVLLGLPAGGSGTYYSEGASRGSTGETSWFGGIVDSVTGWFGDPVNAITGDFHVDATDLTLPGAMPLAIRRNYSSQALSDNEFGQSWKLGYFPYLVVGDNNLIYAAEMDGSVIAYRKDTLNANLYVPKTDDNPSLKNLHNGGVGSTGNPLNNSLLESVEGADTIYTLSGPNGESRRFKVRSFPIGALTRSRPYLETWKDAQGNSLTFQFNTDSTAPEYGLLKRIAANNGNFVGFEYDVFGHIVEAWTGDGRRVKYGYDSQGDLRTVTLPDGAVHSYDYEQETTTAGGESIQTSKHLLVRETKPDGRILENIYDAQRRVFQQKAVVGDTPAPVLNATFLYGAGNTQNPTTKTWTGTTTVKDAYDRPTVITYTDSLTTSEDDPETPAEVREWYLPGDNSAGAYPRSVKKITDRRGVVTFFKYDTRGNLLEKSIGTDAAPADLDGDGIASAGEKAITSWTYVPTVPFDRVETQTDPSGVVTKWFYEDADYPYLATRLEKHAQGQLVSQTIRTFYEKLGATSAYGLLQSERVAAGSADEAQTDWLHDNRGFPTRKTRLTGTSDPAVVVDLVHNGRGELIEEKDALNRRWKYAYDALGRRTWAERRDASNNLVSWDYTYFNLNGEVEWKDGPRFDPEDYIWARYDGHGRRTEEMRWRSETRIDGSGVEAPVGDALMSTTFFKYDKFNNLTETRSPRRHSVTMAYDGIGRMTGRSFYQGYFGAGGVLKANESFVYLPANGNPPANEIVTHTDVLGGITTQHYSARGQLRKRVNADLSVEEWRYYSDGRLFKEILRNGSYWEMTYNDLTRTVTRQLKTSGGAVLKTQVKGYDRRGNCTAETLDGFLFTKIYDDLNRLLIATGPVATATTAQQVETHSYPDAAGREEQVTNGLNEKTITLRDALGRLESVEVRDAANQVVRKTGYAYSPDHHQMTITDGSAPNAIVTRKWTDTFGNTALVRKADDSSEYFYYDNGGLLADHFDRGLRQTSYFRNWRGDVIGEIRPGEVIIGYERDAVGNALQRQMPGGLTEEAHFDTAGRMEWTKLTQGGNTTRLVNFAYYPQGHVWAGLLNTATDARAIVTTHLYDTALRLQSVASNGPDAEDDVTRSFGYNERDMVTSVSESGLNGATQVTRVLGGYGEVSSETVSVGGTAVSALTQHFNGAGRRWKLEGAGADRVFAHRADGLMTSVTVGANAYAASYADNGLLTGRANPFRTVAVQTRDSLGRITDLRTTVGGTLALKETVPVWNDSDQVQVLSNDREGAGSWDEPRVYFYDDSGRLTDENFMPWPDFRKTLGGAVQSDWLEFRYDLDAYAGTGGLGVRTRVERFSDLVRWDEVATVGTFGRVLSEAIGGSQPRSVPLSGLALGAGSVKLTLDGHNLGSVTFPGWQDAQGQWSATGLLAPGYHLLTATATHPSGWVAPAAESVFKVEPRAETLSSTPDEMGHVATRMWSLGKAQMLSWDARGRLVKVVQTGVTPFTWTALYDGLDRRIRTTYTPDGGATVTTNSVFDTEVEFLELGLAINGAWNWKVYGPDLSESYGGLQGLGGLEAVIGADSVTRGIVNDWFGNAAGHVAAPGAPLTWSSAQFLAFGPVPGWNTPPLDGTKPLHELLGYRGLTLDPPGYIHQGLRDYDPVVGRWLSPDPLGHAGSLSLCDYCDNDPVNVFDPDGRIGTKVLGTGGAVLSAVFGGPAAYVGVNASTDFAGFTDTKSQPAAQQLQHNTQVSTLTGATQDAVFAISGVKTAPQVTAPAFVPIPGPTVTSPNTTMRTNANATGTYVNPLTGSTVKANSTLAADHIVPQSWLKMQPGFNNLTPEQQAWLLNHPLNTQGLPQTFNSSKGAQMPGDWQTYKGQPLDPGYIQNDAQRAQFLQNFFQQQIQNLNKANKGE